MMSNNLSTVAVVSAALVSLVALLLAGVAPSSQPLWTFENHVVPLAQQYMAARNNHKNKNKETTNKTKDPSTILQDVVIVITGGTSGIGLGLTQVLARLGAHVVVVGRSATKLQQLVHNVQQQQQQQDPNKNNVKITTIVADLEDLASVARAADEIASKFTHVDILVNNAGLHRGFQFFDTSATPQGYDVVFGVNYLSHFLLTEKLLPQLLQKQSSNHSKKPRIVHVSSTYHFAVDGSELAVVQPNAKQQQQPSMVASQPGGSIGFYIFRTQRQYSNSKLAQILHARSLQRRYPTPFDNNNNNHNTNGTWVRCACPGWVGTSIIAPGSSLHGILHRFGYSMHGWGLASILRAMFSDDDVDETNNRNKNISTTHDFYVNTYWSVWFGQVFRELDLILGQSWFFNSGLRDLLALSVANAMLLTQLFLPYAGTAMTSPESYDTLLQDQLYHWSRAAVAEWL